MNFYYIFSWPNILESSLIFQLSSNSSACYFISLLLDIAFLLRKILNGSNLCLKIKASF
jgi:hypothetical protein